MNFLLLNISNTKNYFFLIGDVDKSGFLEVNEFKIALQLINEDLKDKAPTDQ